MVLTALPNSLKAKYSLFFRFWELSLLKIIEGVTLPCLIENTILNVSGKCFSISFQKILILGIPKRVFDFDTKYLLETKALQS